VFRRRRNACDASLARPVPIPGRYCSCALFLIMRSLKDSIGAAFRGVESKIESLRSIGLAVALKRG
jgi:hypothetical protein